MCSLERCPIPLSSRWHTSFVQQIVRWVPSRHSLHAAFEFLAVAQPTPVLAVPRLFHRRTHCSADHLRTRGLVLERARLCGAKC